MAEIDTDSLRATLDRTGKLATRNEDDPGHISDYWRTRIKALCDAVDGPPATSIDDDEETLQAVEAFIDRAHTALFTELPAERLARGVWLVESAIPRLRSLNNAFSRTWLALAEKFLAGERP